MNWDHLRTFESVARHGSLTAGAKAIGVSQSTASRHIARLEEAADAPLFVRETPLELTERGVAHLESVQLMVVAALAAEATMRATPTPRGEVTLATVGEMVRWELVDRLPGFVAAYPEIRLNILASNDVRSLAAGEADIALRLFRPERGDLIVRKLTEERYAIYAARDVPVGPDTPWMGLTGSLAAIPEQRAAEAFFERPPLLRVEDVEAQAMLVARGVGVAVLPSRLATVVDGIVPVEPNRIRSDRELRLPEREVWMVVHRLRYQLPQVRAVMDWLIG